MTDSLSGMSLRDELEDVIRFGRGEQTSSDQIADACLAVMARREGWQPIEALELQQCHGYRVSDTILMSVYYPASQINDCKIGRVWEEHGKRSLPDNKYLEYELVTHWMPLPKPPTTKE